MSQRPVNQGPNPHKNAMFEAWKDNLPEGSTIERRKDGSVWLRTPCQKLAKGGPDYRETRVDSRQDRDSIVRGEIPWYMKHLERAERAARNPKKDAE